MIRPQSFWLGIGLTLMVCLFSTQPAGAQLALIEASPPADAVLEASPQSIILTFDHIVSMQGSSIELVREDGTFTFTDALTIDPANRFRISLNLPPLVQGNYTVRYVIKGIGSSTVTVGSYNFSIVPPAPELELVRPVNGAAFAQGESIPLEMRIESFEFGFFDNRIRIYVDGELYDEIQATSYTIDGLPPGVHEIRTVLAQREDEEFPETEIAVTIAIAQPDPELQGRQEAAIAAPDPGLRLTPLQLVGVIALTVVLILLGFWLGRSVHEPNQ